MIPNNISNPISKLIENYKSLISETKLQDEVYKWELVNQYLGRPNIEADDFNKEIQEINFGNLFYAMAGAVIKHLAKEKPEELRKLFIHLFDETIDLTTRVKHFNKNSLDLYRSLGETLGHHQDERTISAYLSFHNPEKYTFYKYTFYKKLCKLLNVKEAKKLEKFTHYLALVDQIITEYIEPDTELIELVKKCIPEFYDGDNHRLLVQDILYQMLNKDEEANYWIFQGNPNIYNITKALNGGHLKSWKVAAHKDKIQPKDKVIIWQTGKDAGCYAFAEVVSEVEVFEEDSFENQYYLNLSENEKNNKDERVKIKITRNLANNPLLWSDINDNPEFSKLKVGLQGTNFKATKKEYESMLDLIENKNLFIQAKDKFDSSVFNKYIKYLRQILSTLNLKPNDERILFSVRNNNLNFTVGQRYGINLYLNNSKGVYGVISKDKLNDSSEAYEGPSPQPFYTYYKEFNPQSSEIDSIIEGVKNELSRTRKSGYRKYNNSDFENYVFEMSEEITQTTKPTNFPLNTILYGPPGTGKTYNTILRAAQIIENRTIDSYEEALAIFQDNLHNRIEFITFHQNYSYEDFIQGLRPDTENDNQLTFERKDGVFKIIADKALKNLKASKHAPIVKKSFEEAFNFFVNPLIEGEFEELEVKMKKVSYFITAVTNKSIEFKKASGGTQHTLSIGTLKKMYEAESVLEIQGLSSYYSPLLAELLKIGKDSAGRKEIVKEKNYVIIIDEINRANISRVFGELITLIEPDKRSHGKIPLEARLPSGDPFMVPSNLFIIGTMNTADKSIALLDIALRRRFEFEAMYPQYEINGQEIYDVEILKKINSQIIKGKGHDFQIGHAYFMGDNGDLVQRMNKKVIPLLLEYYMNDEKDVKEILSSAGLKIEENSWPLRITGKND